MKLLISLSYYAPHISGLTLCIKRLAELLADSGYHVTILTTQHEKKLSKHERIDKVAVVRIPYLLRISKGFIMPTFLFTAYKTLKQNNMVLIALPQVEGLFVAVLAKLMKKRIICFYVCEVTVGNGIGAQILTFLVKSCNAMTLMFADEITTLTDDFAKYNDVLKNKKVQGIYPIVIPPNMDGTEQKILKNKLPDKKYYIGYLGRIAHEKGISYLLETIPLLQRTLGDNFVFVFAGPKKTVGEEKYQAYISNSFKKYADFTIQLGELRNEQLGAYYSLLDVLVLPSINNTEAFGMVQVEAMYCGTPAIATNLPGVRVPIRETGMGEIVPPENVEALVDATLKVLQNKKTYVKGKSTIQTIFSAEKILKAYQKLFNNESQ